MKRPCFTIVCERDGAWYKTSEVDPYLFELEQENRRLREENEALKSGRPFKLEQCITFEDIVRREG